MTPEEKKAEEMIDKFKEYCDGFNMFETYEDARARKNAVRCAIRAVNELIIEHTWAAPIGWNIKRKKFWESVKECLEKM